MNALRFSDGIGILSFALFVYLALDAIRQFRPCLMALSKKLTTDEDVGVGNFEPRVQILLCLRGKDPFLDRCLTNLANQAYAEYRVNIILDTEEDEAHAQVQELLTNLDSCRFDIIVRDCLYSTCSRRACSLLTGLNQVADDVDVVVLCDGDTVPHENWLRELTAGLSDPCVQATSGNRWYAPPTPNLGSLCRYFWNAMAVPAMFDYGVPWAGSMAIRRSLFADPKFLKCLQQAFSEDTQLVAYLTSRGVQFKPMPDLPIINEERVSLSSFWGFLIRQLIAARLHHPKWSLVLGHAIVMGVATWILLPLSIIAGPAAVAGWIAGLVTHGVIVHGLIGSYEYRVRRLVRTSRDDSLSPYGWRRILLCIPVGILTMFLYPVAVFRAVILRTHVWRGITYRICNRGVIAIDTQIGELHTIEEYGPAT